MKKHRRRIVLVAAGAALVALAVAGAVLATSQIGVTTTALTPTTGTSFGEIDVKTHTVPADIWQLRERTKGLSDGYVVDNKIASGGTTGWHRHPGPSLIFVINGTVTDYEGDDPTCTDMPIRRVRGSSTRERARTRCGTRAAFRPRRLRYSSSRQALPERST